MATTHQGVRLETIPETSERTTNSSSLIKTACSDADSCLDLRDQQGASQLVRCHPTLHVMTRNGKFDVIFLMHASARPRKMPPWLGSASAP